MITNAPACRTVCNGKPGEVVENLVAAFKRLRTLGIPEGQALLVSRDPHQVARLLPISSPGSLSSIAEAMVTAGCTECAVNYAYAASSMAD